jgi:hypothetical protein
VVAGGLLAACGSTGAAGLVNSSGSTRTLGSAASCAALTPSAQLARARVVFVGSMLTGRTVSLGTRRVLASPARMRVARYVKGHGPETVAVETAATVKSNGLAVAEDGIEPRAGQRWTIYSDSSHQPFETSICAGSRLLGSSSALAGP